MKKTDENDYTVYDASDSGARGRGGFQIIARIVCLVLAFAIWLYVVDNDSDDYEKTFTLIPVEVEGSETLAEVSKMSVINLEESAVSVTVRGKRGDINKLSSEDFRAYVNVGSLTTADRHLVSVLVDLPSGVERINTEPSAVNIYTDELAEREVPVEVVPKYRMESAYTIDKIEKNIETVKIHGPRELLSRIAAARAEVDLGDIVTGVVATGALEPVDKDGVPVDSKYLRLETRDITVSVSVHTFKTVPLSVELSPGYSGERAYRGCTLTTASVTLRGDPKLLAAIDSLTALTVTSDSVDEYIIKTADIPLPDGVSLASAPESIAVRLIFEEKVPETSAEDTTDAPDPENAPVQNVPAGDQ